MLFTFLRKKQKFANPKTRKKNKDRLPNLYFYNLAKINSKVLCLYTITTTAAGRIHLLKEILVVPFVAKSAPFAFPLKRVLYQQETVPSISDLYCIA